MAVNKPPITGNAELDSWAYSVTRELENNSSLASTFNTSNWVINQNEDNALVFSYDGVEKIKLESNGDFLVRNELQAAQVYQTKLMGEVNNAFPLQDGTKSSNFNVYVNGSTVDVLNNGKIPFDATVWDSSANDPALPFDLTTGEFVVPVTGYYYLEFQVCTSAETSIVTLDLPGSTEDSRRQTFSNSTNFSISGDTVYVAKNSIVHWLQKDNRVSVKNEDGETITVIGDDYYSGMNFSYFQGFYVCADSGINNSNFK
jgi:hypothetical protein